ncbi:MAG: ABC transporter permease [Thermoplasmata archaeon]
MKEFITLNLRAIKGRAYPRIVGANREPSWIFFDTILPLLTVAAYVFVYQYLGQIAISGDEKGYIAQFVGYVILGGAMTAYWMNVLWSMAAQFYWEKEIGNLQLYLIAPMSRMAVLGGMAIGGMFYTSVRAISTIVIGVFIFGVVFSVGPPIYLLLVFFLTLVALYGMGMLFASLYMLYGREAWHTSSLLTEPIYLISGFYFPVRYLGAIVAVSASIIPITLGLDALRQLMFTETAAIHGFLPVEWEMVILLALSVLFLFFARHALHYMENLGRKHGRLTMRWQ